MNIKCENWFQINGMNSFERDNLWTYESQFDNFQILNSLSSTVLFQPLLDYEQIQPNQAIQKINFMKAFSSGKECMNSIRLLSTQHIEPQRDVQQQENDSQQRVLNYFCMFSKNQRNNDKKFSLLPYYGIKGKGQKIDLTLDQPNKVIVINNKHLVAVQKKCITVYRIHNEHLIIKDFDSIGIGSKLLLSDLQHLKYKGKDYLLVFGNEKQEKTFFKCLVYEIKQQKLRFIKKATLHQRQNYKPIILFDHYSDRQHNDQQFCLVIGGFSDYEQQHYNFAAFQIHLHLLIEQWLQYPTNLTREIIFTKKHTITSGKAIKITKDISSDECWLLFCTEYQTITKMELNFGRHNDQFLIEDINLDTKSLKIRKQDSGQIDQIYYAENTLYLVRVPQNYLQAKRFMPYRVYWCDNKMQKIRCRPLQQLLNLFTRT